jgi:transposase
MSLRDLSRIRCPSGIDLRRSGICDLELRHRAIEPKNRLGRDRWAVERTLSWLNRFRRLKIRYEHRADINLALLRLGCAFISLRFLG